MNSLERKGNGEGSEIPERCQQAGLESGSKDLNRAPLLSAGSTGASIILDQSPSLTSTALIVTGLFPAC